MSEQRKVIALEVDARAAQRGMNDFAQAAEKGAVAAGKMADAEARAAAAQQKAAPIRLADLRSVEATTAAHEKATAARERTTASMQRQMMAQHAYLDQSEASLNRVAKAFGGVAQLALEHPILATAAAAASARALGGLAGAAATSFGAGSVAATKFANDNAEMGRAVVTAANVAARGLGVAETAATATAAGLTSAANKVTSLTTASGLLARGLGVITPLLGTIAVGFVAFEAGAVLIRKASSDLDRLIALGRQAESLDIGAGFLASFKGVGDRLGVEVAAMDAAIQRASAFSREEFGKPNALSGAIGSYDAAGATGISARTREQAELARTTEERIRVALGAMAELEAKGQRLAALDLSGKVFGTEIAERLRKGETSIAAMVADLSQVRGGDLVNQDDVTRAVALDREIEGIKAEIGRALDVTLDFSKGALSLKETWRDILATMRDYTPNLAGLVKQGDAATLGQIQTLQRQVEAMQTVSIPDAVSKGQTDRVQYLTSLIASWRAEIDRLSGTLSSAAAKIDSDVGRIGEPLRFASDELLDMFRAAEDMARGLGSADRALLGTAGSAKAAGSALADAAIKARGFADAFNAIQTANPNLAGTLSTLGKIEDVNRKLVEGKKGIQEAFNATSNPITDEEARRRSIKLDKEAADAIAAIRTEAAKPVASYVREAELGRLEELPRKLAEAKDKNDELRRSVEDRYRVEMERAATPAARGVLEKERVLELAKLDTALRQVNQTARDDAAEKGAKEAAKSAKEAAKEFDGFKDKAAEAFKTIDPAGALRIQGQELQKELDKYRDQLMKSNPEYVAAMEQKIKLNLDGRDLETVKDKTEDLSKDMARTFSGVFDDMFSNGNKGLDNLLKGFARLGTRSVEKNVITPAIEGKLDFGKMFDMDAWKSAISEGTSDGTKAGFMDFEKLSKLGGKAVMPGLTGGAIGYGTANPIEGAPGGGLSGFSEANDDAEEIAA